MPFPERFHYGFCPETGKKADLMFAQHMLAVLRPRGVMATVMPHGVLFRGGAEKEIRKGFVDHDVLEAVIGLPPNLFYGTGIPACILVMRAKGAKPTERQGKVLFVNADAEYHAGRAQNFLRPEHVEKIVSTFETFADVPGYAAVVTHDELAANDYIVVHELIHLVGPNHGREFWRRLERAMPDCAERKQWLAEHGGRYS